MSCEFGITILRFSPVDSGETTSFCTALDEDLERTVFIGRIFLIGSRFCVDLVLVAEVKSRCVVVALVCCHFLCG